MPPLEPESASLTHLDDRGQVHMVNVGEKALTHRVAIAEARVRMSSGTRAVLMNDGAAKGDVLATVRLAGIMGAKRTAELIPLCHPVALSHVAVDIAWASEVAGGAGQGPEAGDADAAVMTIRTRAECVAGTGVEMEALTAATTAALTLYDMVKAIDRGLVIEQVCLVEKQGGRSGHWRRQEGG